MGRKRPTVGRRAKDPKFSKGTRISLTFQQELAQLILSDENITRVIETGSYDGLGSTTAIAQAILRSGRNVEFESIEVNPIHAERAAVNCRGLPVTIHNGLSFPRSVMPSREEQAKYCYEMIPLYPNIYPKNERQVQNILKEADFPGVEDDLLGRLFAAGHPDLLMLDSAGHLGNVEFEYAMSLITKPTIIALDDIFNMKHHHSFIRIQSDSNFSLMSQGTDRMGHVIASYEPPASSHEIECSPSSESEGRPTATDIFGQHTD